MEAIRKIIEKRGNVLTIDIPENISSTKFEVIVFPLEETDVVSEWNQSIYKNESFEFLNSEEEEVYTINDGKPL